MKSDMVGLWLLEDLFPLQAAQVCLVFVPLLLLGASFSEVVSREDGGCPTPHVAQCFCRRPKVWLVGRDVLLSVGVWSFKTRWRLLSPVKAAFSVVVQSPVLSRGTEGQRASGRRFCCNTNQSIDSDNCEEMLRSPSGLCLMPPKVWCQATPWSNVYSTCNVCGTLFCVFLHLTC